MGALATAVAAPSPAAAVIPTVRWDDRVAGYVRFVERERGLEFVRPVRVRFLEPDAFRRAATAWYDDTTADDRVQADRHVADLLALGLVTEPFDALAASEESDAEGTLGWYDHEREVMVVRGTDVADTEVELTVVHELTHALQDQHFDLGALESRTGTSGEAAALGALIEGDATLVERAYLFSLPDGVQDAYLATPVDDGVPPSWPLVYDLWGAFDYDLAPAALDVAIAAHGRDRIDDLFRSPPRSEEAILDPVALESGDGPRRVDPPRFADGERPRGPADDLGAFTLYLALAARIPWPDALRAVEGWGGDRVRSFVSTVDGVERRCVRLSVVGDTARDAEELHGALRAWVRAMPEGAARVERDDDRVVLSACATGGVPAPADEAMQLAYDRLWERTDGIRQLTDRTLPPDAATRCIADALVADTVAQPLLASDDDLTRREKALLRERLVRHTTACT